MQQQRTRWQFVVILVVVVIGICWMLFLVSSLWILTNRQVKPAKPLCNECLQIVQKAPRVKLTKVDVSNNNKQQHPHKGARDMNGNWGYVPDVTHLRRNPPLFHMDTHALHRGCANHDGNYKMLTQKVVVDWEGHEQAEQEAAMQQQDSLRLVATKKKPRVKLFCLVYTTSPSHTTVIPRIRETWGPKCDGFLVGSNQTDPSIDAVDIPHEGPEEYGNIWQKVRSMWSFVYDHYYDDYDWFHIGGDDLYLIVENLRLYLESEEIRTAANGGIHLPMTTTTTTWTSTTDEEMESTPLFLGRRFALQGNMNEIFNSGGSGYTLNKAALKILVVQGLPQFRPHAKTFSEDTMIASLLKTYHIEPYETKDEMGGERYMPFMPGHHYSYQMPMDDKSRDWYARYSINIKMGLDHCARHSVAFHYVKDQNMYRLHAILYGLCPKQ